MATVLDHIDNDECYTVEELADVLGVSIQRIRQLLSKVKQDKLIPWLVKKDGVANLYAPEFVDQLKTIYLKGTFGKPRNRMPGKNSNAKLLVEVPVFDQQAVDILLKKFGSNEEIQGFLKKKLEEIYQPAIRKINEIKKKQEQELQEAMSSI